MDTNNAPDALRALQHILDALWGRDPELRRSIGVLARWVAELAESGAAGAAAAPSSADSSPAPTPPPAPALNGDATPALSPPSLPPTPTLPVTVTNHDPRTRTSAGVVPLRIGDAVVQVPVAGTTAEIGRARQAAPPPVPGEAPARDADPAHPRSEPNLELIAARCDLKAEACRVYIDRRRAWGDAELEPALVDRIRVMVAKAKSMESCFLWMVYPNQTQPPDAGLTLIAECYANLASACRLVLAVRGGKREGAVLDALQLLAEARSALRAALSDTWLVRDDHDVEDSFAWLRRVTETESRYVPRYMRLDDVADPTAWPDLRARLDAEHARVSKAAQADKAAAAAFNRLAYEFRKRREEPEALAHHEQKIRAALDELASLRVRARDPRWARALAEIAADPTLPAPDHPLLNAAADAAEDESAPDEPAPAQRVYGPSVARVRAALAGRKAVLIGGSNYPHQGDNLVKAFGVDLDWVRVNEHASAEPIVTAVGRPGVSLVLVMVKLAGHHHIDEARAACDRAGVPCVMLKAGVNPERVAADILEQASRALGLGEG